MSRRLVAGLPLLVAGALFSAITGSALGVGLGLLALAAGLLSRRLPLRGIPELLCHGLAAGLGVALASSVELPPGALRGAAASIAVPGALAALGAALLRRLIAAPRAGEPGTIFLGLVAVTLCGATFADRALYLAGAALFLASALLALRAAEEGRPGVGALLLRGWGGGAAIVAGGGAVTLALAVALPLAYEGFGDLPLFRDSPQLGFSGSSIQLGSVKGIYRSETIVLRVHGLSGDPLLRGALFNRYEHGRWLPSPRSVRPFSTTPLGAGAVRIVAEEPQAQPFFLPLAAAAIHVEGGAAQADATGILEPPQGRWPATVSYLPGPREELAPPAPGADDLAVPEKLRPELAELVASWSAGATEPAEILDALQERLERDHVYSLEFEPRGRLDPTLQFLLEGKQGHCEYFASALALLARTAGIPARVVTGYRAGERSAVGGYHLVRGKNAHAWVEAWLPAAGWQVRDPAPVNSLEPAEATETSLVAALVDLSRLWLRDAVTGLLSRPGGALAGLAAWALLAGLTVTLALRRRKEAASAAPWDPRYAPPLPCLPVLLGALASRGLSRGASEPLELFADRVEAAGAAGAAGLVRRYAALRYGGLGDEAGLSAEVRAFAGGRARPEAIARRPA